MRTGPGPQPILLPMDDRELAETTVDRRVIHRGRYLTFTVDTVRDATGAQHTREVAVHPGAVAMVALDRGDVLMVRQYRTPAGRVLLEIPAGTLDRMEDGTIELPDAAAPRELEEETGYRAAHWRKLGSFYTAPGFATELMHLYLATGLSPVEGYSGPEPDEHLDMQRLPLADALRMAEDGTIQDAKSICGLFWVERLIARGEVTL